MRQKLGESHVQLYLVAGCGSRRIIDDVRWGVASKDGCVGSDRGCGWGVWWFINAKIL